MWINRDISSKIERLAAQRPALLLTGARQTGKSSLLRKLFPDHSYITLDRPLTAEAAESDPRAFLDQYPNGAILDEVQRAPKILHEIKIRIDENRSQYGRWILTGSQIFQVMRGVGESLAGRISILHLEPLSRNELKNAHLKFEERYQTVGGYPELWANQDLLVSQFFNDYVTTYLERDLRGLLAVESLRDFDRFLRACATRAGQLVNYTDLGRDVGISGVTAKKWLEVLCASSIVTLLEPYFTNHSLRLTKAPKLYFNDHGLLCFFLKLNEQKWRESHYAGAIWENLIFSELLRYKENCNKPFDVYFWRDKYGKEIDFVIEHPNELVLVEAKASEQPRTEKLDLLKITAQLSKKTNRKPCVACLVDSPTALKKDEMLLFNPLTHGIEKVLET